MTVMFTRGLVIATAAIALFLTFSAFLTLLVSASPAPIADSVVLAQYDADGDGTIEQDEFITASKDYFAKRINRAMFNAVLKLHLKTSGLVVPQGWGPLCDEYDTNGDLVIDAGELQVAYWDYEGGLITYAQYAEVASCSHPPTPTPVPTNTPVPTPTDTPTPVPPPPPVDTPTPTPAPVPLPTPDAPGSPQLTSWNASSVNISWSAVTGAASYQVLKTVGTRSKENAGSETSSTSKVVLIPSGHRTCTNGSTSTSISLTVKAKGDGTTRANKFGPESSALSVNLPCNPKVTVSAGSASVTEGSAVEFTFTASPAPLLSNDTITVGFSHTTSGDFLTGSVPSSHQFKGTSGTSTLQLPTTNDKLCEANGSVGITITSVSFSSSASSSDDVKAASYGIGTPKSATVTIQDNDCSTPVPIPGPKPGPVPGWLYLDANCGGVNNGIKLSWGLVPSSTIGYEVQRGVDNGSGMQYTTIATTGSSARSYTDAAPGLRLERNPAKPKEGKPYNYRVRARFVGSKIGAWSNIVAVSLKPIIGQWGVLDYICLTVDWVVPVAEWQADRVYKVTVPAGTGFQINEASATDSRKCTWSSWPDDSTKWVSPGTSFHLVRCKRGTGTANITVQEKPGNKSSPVKTVKTIGPIRESWHQPDHEVSYKTAFSPMDGTKPTPPTPTVVPTPNVKMFEEATDDAAKIWSGNDPNHKIWDGKINPITFVKIINDDPLLIPTPYVTVKAYWNNPKDDKCRADTIGCIFMGDTYPHLKWQTLWIEHPPQFSHDPETRAWTDNLEQIDLFPTKFYYLPQIMMHEFGHALGLLHPPSGLMGPIAPIATPIVAPTEYDVNGVIHTYQGHTKE